MNYNGRLYGRMAGTYFDTGRTSAEWDFMEKEISELRERNISTSRLVELIDFIDDELRAFYMLKCENYDYKRNDFVEKLAVKVRNKIKIAMITFKSSKPQTK